MKFNETGNDGGGFLSVANWLPDHDELAPGSVRCPAKSTGF
jgi:hypothetical protein